MTYENVCIECGQPFESEDEDARYCAECWQKVVGEFIALDSDDEPTDSQDA